jgi:hypothetical protein
LPGFGNYDSIGYERFSDHMRVDWPAFFGWGFASGLNRLRLLLGGRVTAFGESASKSKEYWVEVAVLVFILAGWTYVFLRAGLAYLFGIG